MTQSDQTSDAGDEPRSEKQVERGKDVMRGRSFAGANIASTEEEQTRDRERVVRGELLDEAGEITDAEVEARELRRSERHED